MRPSRTEPFAIDALLAEGTTALARVGIANARREARLLLEAASGITLAAQRSGRIEALPHSAAEVYRKHVARRAGGEPYSRIRGVREFWSLPFRISDATLDPRPDSETVVSAALEHIKIADADSLRLLDLGTGSGCLLIALLTELPRAVGVGVDRSFEAARVASDNARTLGVSERAGFVVGDWTRAIQGPFDLVVANPPYVPSEDIGGLTPDVRLFDPRGALDGGNDGLMCYRDIAAGMSRLLSPKGVAVFEVGAGQARDVAAICEERGLNIIEMHNDLSGIQRCIVMSSALGAGSKKGLD